MTRFPLAAVALAAALGAWLAVPAHGDGRATGEEPARLEGPADWLAGAPGADHAARAYPQYAQQQVTTPIRFLGVQRLVRRLADGERPVIVDVRTQPEFEQAHIPGAVNIPLDQVDERLEEIPRQGTVVLY